MFEPKRGIDVLVGDGFYNLLRRARRGPLRASAPLDRRAREAAGPARAEITSR